LAGSTIPLLTIFGRFYRAILAARVNGVLAPPVPASAGRYHRLGQPALYLTSDPEGAYSAVSGYVREDGLARTASSINRGICRAGGTSRVSGGIRRGRRRYALLASRFPLS
jgi:hypothetical protein